jgi:hypothetical protein
MLVLGGGALSSYLYQKDFPTHLPRPTMGDGALLGLLAGVVGAVVDTLVTIPIAMLGIGAGQTQSLIEMVRDNPEIPPEVVGLMENLLAGGAVGIGLVISFIFTLVIFSIFGTLGGLLGMAILQPRGTTPPSAPAGPGPDYLPPPPPPGPGTSGSM